MWSLLPICRETLGIDLDLLGLACLLFRRTELTIRDSHLDSGGDLDTGAGADLTEIFDQVPSIATGRLDVTELPGGLTNRNFKISKEKATYVARVASGGSELLAINREHEYRNSRRAAAA